MLNRPHGGNGPATYNVVELSKASAQPEASASAPAPASRKRARPAVKKSGTAKKGGKSVKGTGAEKEPKSKAAAAKKAPKCSNNKVKSGRVTKKTCTPEVSPSSAGSKTSVKRKSASVPKCASPTKAAEKRRSSSSSSGLSEPPSSLHSPGYSLKEKASLQKLAKGKGKVLKSKGGESKGGKGSKSKK